jgi:hypothetical protein
MQSLLSRIEMSFYVDGVGDATSVGFPESFLLNPFSQSFYASEVDSCHSANCSLVQFSYDLAYANCSQNKIRITLNI